MGLFSWLYTKYLFCLERETLWRFAVARQGPVIPYLIATNKTCEGTVLSHLDDSEVEDGQTEDATDNSES